MKTTDERKVYLITSSKSIKNFLYRNIDLCKNLKKKNLNYSIININQSKVSNKKYKIINVKSYNQLINIFKKDKKITVINFISKNFNFFYYFRLLKKYDVKLIEIDNIGDIQSSKFFYNFFSYKIYLNFILKIINKLLINFFFKIDYLKKVDILFYCQKKKYFNSNCYRKFFLINSKSYDSLIKKTNNNYDKYIVFLDSCLNHVDRVYYEGYLSEINRKNYYRSLSIALKEFQLFYKKKVIILLHPDSNFFEIKKKLLEFKIVQFDTQKYILQSSLVLFHESSSVLDAVFIGKKIINLQSSFMGRYFDYRNKLYSEKICIPSLNIDFINQEKISVINKRLKNNNYNNYIKSNLFCSANKKGIDQIINQIQKI
jgi:hypothetical protein